MDEKEKIRQYWFLSLKIIGVIFGILFSIWFIYKVSWVISLFLISVLIVYSVSPFTDWLEKQKFSRTSAVVITFSLLMFFLLGFLYFTIPRLYAEVLALANYAPVLFEYIEEQGYLEKLYLLMEAPEFAQNLEELFDAFPGALEGLHEVSKQLTNLIFALITVFFEFLILIFLVFYLLKDIKEIKSGVISFVPSKRQDEAREVLKVIDLKVGQFLRGNLIRCSLVGFVTGLGLFIIDIRFYILLGLLAAILNIIVYIGPYIAAIPAIIVALSYSIETAIIVALMYVVIQSIDAFVLYPVLLGKAVDLRPFTIVIAISIGGALYGIVGFIISVPIAAILKVLLNYYYLEKNNSLRADN
ncbi:AI-2E family transporter [Natranaerofaba carboxydovora]|uniref:AI-2E family transporter n=1 Tax=Natranaerofaba carboxydovora TaxID=2742683 RepID=UPI001F1297A2|nr:AI-2E family transporter [Natranaerofaba carboxydovora]UMZ73612.1 AI-2 transport protein TqsA [Natranaerofaba carboxydovora]